MALCALTSTNVVVKELGAFLGVFPLVNSSYMIENQKETPQEKPKKNPNQPP
jgi:hypothetical protein